MSSPYLEFEMKKETKKEDICSSFDIITKKAFGKEKIYDFKNVEVNVEDQTNPTTTLRLEDNGSQLEESVPKSSQQFFLQYEENMLLTKEEEVKKNEEALQKICQDWEAEYAAEQKLKREEGEKHLQEQQRIKRFEKQQKQILEQQQQKQLQQQQSNGYRSLHTFDGQNGYLAKQRRQTSTKFNKKKGSRLSDSSSSESSSSSGSSGSDTETNDIKDSIKTMYKPQQSCSKLHPTCSKLHPTCSLSLSLSSESSDSGNEEIIKNLSEKQPEHPCSTPQQLFIPDNSESFFIPRRRITNKNDDKQQIDNVMGLNQQNNKLPEKMFQQSFPNLSSSSDSDSDIDTSSKPRQNRKRKRRSPSPNSQNHIKKVHRRDKRKFGDLSYHSESKYKIAKREF